MLEISLVAIVVLVLALPLVARVIERNLEGFLFFMGILAVSCSHFLGTGPAWSLKLVEEAAKEPLMITVAVLMFGFIVYWFKNAITGSIICAERKLGSKLFCFALVTALGLVSSVITAVIAAIVLVETVSALKLLKEYEIKLVVLGCFSIGLGAALTPVGEPLSAICTAKLAGEPYNAGFFFLMGSLGKFIIPGIFGLGIIGAFIEPSIKAGGPDTGFKELEKETIKDILVRTFKVYIFIAGLVLLGAGFKPVIDAYIIKLPAVALYWLNAVSAVVDNATLTAAEISPKMAMGQIQAALMGLLIAGGMLITGNIPNIISSCRLGITSRQWAKVGLPIGFILMAIYFVILII